MASTLTESENMRNIMNRMTEAPSSMGDAEMAMTKAAHDIMTDPVKLSELWDKIESAIDVNRLGIFTTITSLARGYDLSPPMMRTVVDRAVNKATGLDTVYDYWKYIHRETGQK